MNPDELHTKDDGSSLIASPFVSSSSSSFLNIWQRVARRNWKDCCVYTQGVHGWRQYARDLQLLCAMHPAELVRIIVQRTYGHAVVAWHEWTHPSSKGATRLSKSDNRRTTLRRLLGSSAFCSLRLEWVFFVLKLLSGGRPGDDRASFVDSYEVTSLSNI